MRGTRVKITAGASVAPWKSTPGIELALRLNLESRIVERSACEGTVRSFQFVAVRRISLFFPSDHLWESPLTELLTFERGA